MTSNLMPSNCALSYRSTSEVAEACGRWRALRSPRCQPARNSRISEGSGSMVRENEIRKAEVAVTLPPTTDAGLLFIGRIRTPWTARMETPRQGRADGPLCRIRYSSHGYRHSPVWHNTNELKCFIGCTFPAAISSCQARRTMGLREADFR